MARKPKRSHRAWNKQKRIYYIRDDCLYAAFAVAKRKPEKKNKKKPVKGLHHHPFTSWVYNEPIQRPAPSWLVSLIGRPRRWVRIPYKPEFFSGILFATAKVAYTTAMFILHLILHTVHIYDFHILKTSKKDLAVAGKKQLVTLL